MAKLMLISEAARKVPCSTATLRKYDARGIVKPEIDSLGRRMFDEMDVLLARETMAACESLTQTQRVAIADAFNPRPKEPMPKAGPVRDHRPSMRRDVIALHCGVPPAQYQVRLWWWCVTQCGTTAKSFTPAGAIHYVAMHRYDTHMGIKIWNRQFDPNCIERGSPCPVCSRRFW